MADQNNNKKQYGANYQNHSDNSKRNEKEDQCPEILGRKPTSHEWVIYKKDLNSDLEGLARAAFGEVALAEFCVREDDDNVEFDPKNRTTRKRVIVEPIVWLEAANPNIAATKDSNALIDVPVQQYSENYKKFVKAYCDDNCKNPFKDNITKRTREVNGRRYRAIRCSIPKIYGSLLSEYLEKGCDIRVHDIWSSNVHNKSTFKGLRIVMTTSSIDNTNELLSGKQVFAPRGKKHRDEDDDED